MKNKPHVLAFTLCHWLCFNAFLFPILLMAQSANSQLIIQLSGLRNTKGQIMIAIHNRPQSFPGKVQQAIIRKSIPANQSVITIEDMIPGTYAVSVAHDEDGNGKHDTNIFGIPSEGYGVSRNVQSTLGPPKFDECRFELSSSPLQLQIKMRYL